MISIVDYGLGNILAFVNIYKKLNIPVEVVSSSSELSVAEKIILPGVGSFDWAMSRLNNSGMRDMLDKLVKESDIPVLGICVGMQMMAKSSDEGKLDGLGWIDAEVKHLGEQEMLDPVNLPHMGWNNVKPVIDSPLFSGIDKEARFYFLHSYYFSHANESQVLSRTFYNISFASCVHYKNRFGVQFHPEKSHFNGVQLLKNFAEIKTC
jgi:imidazole glycerol-phosphate synthase subunit HisH